MKNFVVSLFLLSLMASSAMAEIKSIDMTIFGMDWEVCAHAVRVSLKAVPGVDSVDVSLEKGLAVVKMKPGNTATMKQLNEAISKNGFTMKDSTATIVGTVVVASGKTQLLVSGSSELLTLVPESQASSDATSLSGRSVLVEGVVPEASKGKVPDSIRYRAIKEETQKWT